MLLSLLFGCEKGDLEAGRANCLRDARASVDAFARRDVDAMVRFTHPEALRALGTNADERTATLAASFADMDRQGVRFDPPSLVGPDETFRGHGDRRFAIVVQTLIVHAPQSRTQSKGYLLGISDDRGATWRFVDSASLATIDVTKAFADYPVAQRALPKLAPPTVVPIVSR